MIDEFSSIYTVHITLNIQLLIIKGMYSIIYIYIYMIKLPVDGGIINIVQSYKH